MAEKKTQAEKLAFIEKVCVNTMFAACEKLLDKDITPLEREAEHGRMERWSKLYERLKQPKNNDELLTALAVDKIKEQYT